MSQLAYRKVYTSAEVYAVIRARHAADMTVFGTISEPDGNPWGDSDDCRMLTEWGIKGHDVPLIGIDQRWSKDAAQSGHRDDTYTYWLCSAINSEETA